MPAAGFEPVRREQETASLDDEDFEFTGKKIQAYIIGGVRYAVNTWKGMLIQGVRAHVAREAFDDRMDVRQREVRFLLYAGDMEA